MITPDLFGLGGRTAVVTGGASGLGYVIAGGLREAGARVVITSRRPEKIASALASWDDDGIIGIVCDMRDESSIEALFDEVSARVGVADVLVANAGTAWVAPASTTSRQAWTKVLETNVLGPAQCASRFARDASATARPGAIVLISSIAGQRASAILATAAYAASKAALGGLTRQLAVEWAGHEITVNAVAPGYFTGGMSDPAIATHGEDLIARIPAGRLGGADDLKGVVVFLASDAARFVTGQVIVVDGGQSVLS